MHEQWESIVRVISSVGGRSKAVPDLAFLLNAGLAAYTTWSPTLVALQDIPVVVTDYCEEAAVRAQLVCPDLTQVMPNPFRSPLRLPNSGLRIPCYSNAFMCVLWLILMAVASCSCCMVHVIIPYLKLPASCPCLQRKGTMLNSSVLPGQQHGYVLICSQCH